MSKGIAVIGAAFGDEGKGLMTDYLADAERGNHPVVIRFNGGAQAGHTVIAPNGDRHVFHHIGSGTMAGAPTFLSEHFVLNPVLYVREMGELGGIESVVRNPPIVNADPNCMVTLISDMMLNQWAEEARGTARHGSCGVGFGETIERDAHLPLRYADIPLDTQSPMKLRAFVLQVNREWVPLRAAALGIELTEERLAYLNDKQVIEKWASDFMFMRHRVGIVTPEELRRRYQTFIFEGAQGLALDGRLDNPFFPHVTRSRTGRVNVVSLAEKLALSSLDIVYMTRSYLTRHGAGEMPGEMYRVPYDNVRDYTNVPHDFQGSLRFAYLNLDLLAVNIATDMASVRSTIPVRSSLAITHMDQLNSIVHYQMDGDECKCRYNDLPERAKEGTGLDISYLSFGPSRNQVAHGAEYIRDNLQRRSRAIAH